MPTSETERKELLLMREIGLKKFETSKECMLRQGEMLRRFKKLGCIEVAGDIARCTYDFCAEETCKEGCHLGSRRRRVDTILTGHAILRDHPGPKLQVTVVHPRWVTAVGKLSEMNIAAMRQWNLRALGRLGVEDFVAVGIVEVSLNAELSGERHWAGEIQQIVAGASHDQLTAAFKIPDAQRQKKHQSPVMISKVENLGAQLGYAQKHFVQERRAYISAANGRQSRNKLPPSAEDWAEHDAWLLSLSLGDRTIAHGCNRRGRKLYPVT